MKQYLIEGLGSGIYTYLVVAAVMSTTFSNSQFVIPILESLLFGLLIYLGYKKGRPIFINPAVALAAWAVKLISLKEVSKVVAAQFAGALVAMLFGMVIFNSVPYVLIDFGSYIFVAELIGMTVFAFGFFAVLSDKVAPDLVGHVSGLALFLGMVFALLAGSSAILNPFVALAVGSLTPEYFLASILGAMIGGVAYKKIYAA